MSGDTGRMTADALKFRGPRLILAVKGTSYVLVSEYDSWPEGYKRLAISYTASYLRRIAKGNGYVPATGETK